MASETPSRRPSLESYTTGGGDQAALSGRTSPDSLFSDSESQEKREENLSDRIAARLERSTYDGKDFLPDDCIDELVTIDAVREHLECPPTKKKQEDQILDFIFDKQHGAKKLFVIALLCDIPSKDLDLAKAMLLFRKVGVHDGDLPIKPDECAAITDSRSPWNPVKIRIFDERQWAVLAPVFTDQNTKLRLEPGHIFPIVGDIRGGEEGAFGEVVQVTIHEQHWSRPILKYDKTRADIAIKKLKKSGGNTTDRGKLDQLQKEWDREVAAHVAMRQAQHKNIIEFITAVERGHDRFLLFRWAEEGTLRQFWEVNPRPVLTTTLIKDAVLQIIGLADALHKLHTGHYGSYRAGGESFRHGDLKPDNILCVTIKPPQENCVNVPELKISDMGLAKHHNVATELRPPTSMRYTTTIYEPPEVMALGPQQGRSRRYDMWSLGCIILETIIWLLYGNRNLETFNAKIVDERGQKCHWFEFRDKKDGPRGQATVHQHVQDTMRTLCADQECGPHTAMRDLLDIVQTKLLVVKLGIGTFLNHGDAGGPKSQPGCRIYSGELLECFNKMLTKGKADERYWFTGKSRKGIDRLVVIPDPESPVAQVEKIEFPVDNKFASQLMAKLSSNDLFPPPSQSLKLCEKCRMLDLCQPMFHIVDFLSELKSSRASCDFCKMRWEVCHHLDRDRVKVVRFDRDQSMLRLNEGLTPVLSICRSPDFTNPNSHVAQIGLPRITKTDSPSHFSTLRHWISQCDSHHTDCNPLPTRPVHPPTRLIDVGTKDAPLVRLFETQRNARSDSSSPLAPSIPYKYIALSHPWGVAPHFCTYASTLAQHKQRIPIDGPDFPATFRDAITTTRELGVRYLWIDSICIVQGEDGDFDTESERMEDVFSSAYCVIAASSARGQRDGFLVGRKERQFLELSKGLYVCRFIDNFGDHVLDSPLSKRGWVLQERALARRTIYFTDWQAYWECGDGVRCETMTKVDNKLASFLGDPNFPSKLSGNVTDRGEKIRFYESLYQQYSRLDFTRIADRPVAIAGLEQRMVRDLGARGGFGIFDDDRSLLQRTLLWRRGKEVAALERVPLTPGKGEALRLPSWSWMAYDGAIDFLDLPLGGVEWMEDHIHSPWTRSTTSVVAGDVVGRRLSAVARPFLEEPVDRDGDQSVEDFEIVFDAGDDAQTTGWETWRCVVVGTRRAPKGMSVPVGQRTHYFLIIGAVEGREGVYTRIGVGKMAGALIGEALPDRVVVE
ncbi:hypothetical protein B0T16DRAFT_456125 [Cercophora newfieldiana]|uniref:Protein kinase domain-containing protein n=1 Tax=Cercophora newfieldiana TaxID=92897 RepID=A0AA39Y9X9_9PEZI|nr:hypothetical protein B0T16DRAFT_456125 [Cercophora newfieldiana]